MREKIKIPKKIKPVPLARWLSASYLRTAVIPLCIIELGFLLSYWATGNFTYQRNVDTVNALSEQYLGDIATREAANIDATLGNVEGLARVFAAETGEALRTPHEAPLSEKARYHLGRDGTFHTVRGGPKDTASFYSGYRHIGPREMTKVWRASQLDHTMRHIQAASPLVRQVYFNTWDSYNRIYPYFDVTRRYAPKMNIPSYNFYYEADEKHNPARKVVWTDPYVDPAGNGWMVSAIAPVYFSNRLEAVVGIDLTVETIVKRILALDLPWNGYAMLVGRDGTILALPPAGERDLGLAELKDHDYADAIRSDTFKPEQFNIVRRPELKALASAIVSGKTTVNHITLGGRAMLAANARVMGPGWTLVVLAPASQILADASSLHDQLMAVGLIMLLILLGFYALFTAFLLWRAREISKQVAEPLRAVEAVMARIGAGEYEQEAPRFGVQEFDSLSERLVETGHTLGLAHRQVIEQEAEVRRALDTERRVTAGQRRFINILSHEFRTPLSVIDSCGQILRRRATRLTVESTLERADMIRRAAARIGAVMDSALQLVRMENGATTCQPTAISVGELVRDVINSAGEGREVLTTVTPEADGALVFVDQALVKTALIAIVENACRYSPDKTPVEIAAKLEGDRCMVSVRDKGPGIAAEDLPMVRERFWRGTNSTAVPGAGTGLYLATTLINANGGVLDIVSAEGGGTEVTASLPLATVPVARLAETTS